MRPKIFNIYQMLGIFILAFLVGLSTEVHFQLYANNPKLLGILIICVGVYSMGLYLGYSLKVMETKK